MLIPISPLLSCPNLVRQSLLVPVHIPISCMATYPTSSPFLVYPLGQSPPRPHLLPVLFPERISPPRRGFPLPYVYSPCYPSCWSAVLQPQPALLSKYSGARRQFYIFISRYRYILKGYRRVTRFFPRRFSHKISPKTS
jgi:hypothetical protein